MSKENMVGSGPSDIIFISVNDSITLMGKVWLIVMIFLRVLVLLFAGYPLYQDEQERFVCNTIQPGCANVCYNLFSPVSLFRFWLVQLVTLNLPFIFFLVYVVHEVSNGLSVRGGARCFTGAYFLHLLFRTLLEAGFGVAHYYLFGFQIPTRFLCQQAPCTTQVDCYVSRPTEKTVMLNFMLAMATLSLLLNVVDLICAIKHSVRQKTSRKMMMEKMFEEERCFLSAEVALTGTDSNAAPAQQDLEAQSGKTGSFRKRHGSRVSCGEGKLCSGQEESTLKQCSHPCSLEPPCCNNKNNDDSQEDILERNGSEVALCPQEQEGTPRSIRINKRSRLKPPPPPRREIGLSSGESGAQVGNISTATAVCTRRVGQCMLVELGNEGGQEKRSEWV
uniref:Gap junction protein n=1 Tax=Kryptolebias marmoratus TaxID=37003 RepID=A0A3Q3ADZ6_KRYMA